MSDRHLPKWRAPMDTGDVLRSQLRAVKASERILYESYEKGEDDRALKAVTPLTQ